MGGSISCTSIKPIDQQLVIIGGGIGGAALASLADSVFDVTVIEKRGALINKVGLPRGIVDAKFQEQNVIPHQKLSRGNITTGTVTQVDAKQITLQDGTQIAFDYLVVAVGGRSGFAEPPSDNKESTKEGILAYYADLRTSIDCSTHCVIVGGGPVGVELAGEMRDYFPDKKITIIHHGNGLCHTQQDSLTTKAFQDKLAKACADAKIDVKLGVRGNLSDLKIGPLGYHEGKVDLALSDNTSVPCDLVLPCIGFTPAGREIKGIPLDEKGFVKTNELLQIEGFSNAYAIGDCNNSAMTKLAVHAGSSKGTPMPDAEADIAFANLYAQVQQKTPTKKVSLEAPNATMIVPVGQAGGAVMGIPSLLSGIVLRFKKKDYFLGDLRKKMGQA